MMRAFLAGLLGLLAAGSTAEAGVLDQARATGVLRLGYRVDAMPFSSTGPDGAPAGYSIALCKAVVDAVRAELKIDRLDVEWKTVSTTDRFERVAAGDVDMLCSADSVTLERRQQVDYSLLTFATGMGLLYRADGPQNFAELRGKTVGVRAGTSTEADLREAFAREQITDIAVVNVPSHEEGVARLAAGELSAYFADGAILLWYWLGSPQRDQLKLSSRSLSYEPYALVLPRGDPDFRLVVDRTLAGLYRSGAIEAIFAESFKGAEPAELVKALFRLEAIPQ